MVKERGMAGGLVSSYMVGHLATSSYSKELKESMVVSEAFKTLSNLEAKNKLWPESLLLKVDEFCIQLESTDMHGNSEQVIEKIALSAIRSCQEGKDIKTQKEILLIAASIDGNVDLHCFRNGFSLKSNVSPILKMSPCFILLQKKEKGALDRFLKNIT